LLGLATGAWRVIVSGEMVSAQLVHSFRLSPDNSTGKEKVMKLESGLIWK